MKDLISAKDVSTEAYQMQEEQGRGVRTRNYADDEASVQEGKAGVLH